VCFIAAPVPAEAHHQVREAGEDEAGLEPARSCQGDSHFQGGHHMTDFNVMFMLQRCIVFDNVTQDHVLLKNQLLSRAPIDIHCNAEQNISITL
jgi:hypothetical protein